MSPTPRNLTRARKLCLALPEVTEKLSHGAPGWFVTKGRMLANYVEGGNHHGAREALWIKSTFDAQEALLQIAPQRYFSPPYVGVSGWVGAWVDAEADPDWSEIAELLQEAWRLAAPKRLLAAHR
jgi:hypothetical protein